MMSYKLVFLVALVATISTIASAGSLNTTVIPNILQDNFQLAPTKEGYRLNLEEPNGSKREEVAMVVNTGTPNEQLVVMGNYSVNDDKNDYETPTMHTVDKHDDKPHYLVKNRGLSPGSLKSLATKKNSKLN